MSKFQQNFIKFQKYFNNFQNIPVNGCKCVEESLRKFVEIIRKF